MRKEAIGSLCILFLLVSFGSLVSAAGVATPYWKENPLLLAPGESSIITLHLQNTGDENMTFNVTITSDGNIAMLKKSIYEVKAGEINIPVEVEVNVPKNIETGLTYKVSLSFMQISAGEGMVSVSGGFTTNFPVKVVSPEKSILYGKKTPVDLWVWLIPLIIIGIVIAMLVLIKAKKIRKKTLKSK